MFADLSMTHSHTDEQTLRKKIAEIQDYRRNGITTVADAQRFDRLRNERVSLENTARLDCQLIRNLCCRRVESVPAKDPFPANR
jgi:hypothetical protein